MCIIDTRKQFKHKHYFGVIKRKYIEYGMNKYDIWWLDSGYVQPVFENAVELWIKNISYIMKEEK